MTTRTLSQNAAMHTLFSKLGIDEDTRKMLCDQVSKGRTGSTKELSYDEAKMLIAHLNRLAGDANLSRDDKANKMRRKIISMAHEMGWQLQGGKADMQRINAWCVKFGTGHKTLNDYTYTELTTLVSQFEGAYKHYLTTIKKA